MSASANNCVLTECPKFTVAKYLHQLQQGLPRVPPIPDRALKALHKTRDYEGMVALVKKTMNIEVRLIVGWVNSGGPPEMANAPAWIRMPEDMPLYGTKAFRELKLTMYIRKSFLDESTYDQIAIMVAHELSHVVLNSIKHSLRGCEKAVDLTAMLLGFSRLYEAASHTHKRYGNTITHRQIGYLAHQEVRDADQILTPPRMRRARTLRATVRAYLAPLLSIGGVIALVGGIQIYDKWQLHQKLLAEQVEVQQQIPKQLNYRTTHVGVLVGFTSLTNLYKVAAPKSEIDLVALEARLRNNSCTGHKKAMIREGATYNYEYRDTSGDLIGRFEIASCP